MTGPCWRPSKAMSPAWTPGAGGVPPADLRGKDLPGDRCRHGRAGSGSEIQILPPDRAAAKGVWSRWIIKNFHAHRGGKTAGHCPDSGCRPAPPGRLWPGAAGGFAAHRPPARCCLAWGLFGLIPADLGPVPAVGAFVAGSTGSLAPALFLFSPLLYAALSPADCLEEPADRHLGVDLDLPGLRPDGGGPADAVLRRGVRTGVCPGKYAVVDFHRAGDAPGLDAGTVSGQPVSVWRSLPCCASGCGDLPGGWRRRPAGF